MEKENLLKFFIKKHGPKNYQKGKFFYFIQEYNLFYEMKILNNELNVYKKFDITTSNNEVIENKTIDKSNDNFKKIEKLIKEKIVSLEYKYIILENKDLMRLVNNTGWINDQIIDYYLSLLREKFKENYYFLCNFYQKFKNGYNFKQVEKYTKNINLADYKNIFIPVHVDNNHWIIVILDLKNNTFKLFDCLYQNKYLEKIYKDINQYIKDITKRNINLEIIDHDSPVQKNNFDCGIYLLTITYFLSINKDIKELNGKDMNYYRKKLLFSVLSKNENLLKDIEINYEIFKDKIDINSNEISNNYIKNNEISNNDIKNNEIKNNNIKNNDFKNDDIKYEIIKTNKKRNRNEIDDEKINKRKINEMEENEFKKSKRITKKTKYDDFIYY